MSFFALINHIQAKIKRGGRVHGVGQGHQNGQATNPAVDRPTNAPIGYMNADLLDGLHAKETYQSRVASVVGGLNADTLDGVDKSLGHVPNEGDFNQTVAPTAATCIVTFTGVVANGDQVNLTMTKPDRSVVVMPTITMVSPANLSASLDQIVAAVNLAGSALVGDLTAVRSSGTTITFTTVGMGERANIYTLDVQALPHVSGAGVFAVSGANAGTDVAPPTEKVCYFTGGGPIEGLNADKLDDLHAREWYHKPASPSSPLAPDSKMPPAGRGINADTLDSFHGRESYHGVDNPINSGLNADTLDGVHKLYGNKRGTQPPTNYGVLTLVLGDPTSTLPINGTAGQSGITISLFNTDGTQLGTTHTFTSTVGDVPDDLGSQINTLVNLGTSDLFPYISSAYNAATNQLTLTAKFDGERNQYTLQAQTVNPGGATVFEIEVLGGTYDTFIRAGFVPPAPNAKLGVDADMLDGIQAAQGHVTPSELLDGQNLSQGINADLVDGYHVRAAHPDGVVGSSVDGSGVVILTDTAHPYIPIADGVGSTIGGDLLHNPSNPGLDADSIDGVEGTGLGFAGSAPSTTSTSYSVDHLGKGLQVRYADVSGTPSIPSSPTVDHGAGTSTSTDYAIIAGGAVKLRAGYADQVPQSGITGSGATWNGPSTSTTGSAASADTANAITGFSRGGLGSKRVETAVCQISRGANGDDVWIMIDPNWDIWGVYFRTEPGSGASPVTVPSSSSIQDPFVFGTGGSPPFTFTSPGTAGSHPTAAYDVIGGQGPVGTAYFTVVRGADNPGTSGAWLVIHGSGSANIFAVTTVARTCDLLIVYTPNDSF